MLLTVLVVFVTGVFASNILGQRLVQFWEGVLGRIPVVKTIYNGVKQVSDTLFAPRRPGVPQGAAGAVSARGQPGPSRSSPARRAATSRSHLQGDYVSVYVPTTPNPTSGFFLMMPQRRRDRARHERGRGAQVRHLDGRGAPRRPRAPRPRHDAALASHAHPTTAASSAPQLLGKTVTLCGWAHRRRDHGGVIFIDLRDREGLAQVVSDPDRKETFATADKLRNEYVLKVTGMVRRAPRGHASTRTSPAGEVEVLAHEIEILNPSLTPPFQLDEENLSENVRLKHRVLDLRRPQMQKNLMLRYRVAMAVRRYLDAHGFIDIETPMLTRSTPEGARDYLVPSRRARRASSTRCRSRRSCSSRC